MREHFQAFDKISKPSLLQALNPPIQAQNLKPGCTLYFTTQECLWMALVSLRQSAKSWAFLKIEKKKLRGKNNN
jgi:hypothetical protein